MGHIVNLLIIYRYLHSCTCLQYCLWLIVMASLYSDAEGRRASEIRSINIRTCDGEQRSG
jgi:hypothetical protein